MNVHTGTRFVIAQFAGQGSTYIDNLRRAVGMRDNQEAENFLQICAETLEDCLAKLRETEPAKAAKYFSRGLDFRQWCAEKGVEPPEFYLQATPVSMPLIYVTQLFNYFLNWQQSDFLFPLVHAAIGHSQGMAAAVAVGLSRDKASFLAVTQTLLKVLFRLGVCTQEAFDAHTDGNVAHAMCAIMKLSLSAVQGLVSMFNRANRDKPPVAILLHNGKVRFHVRPRPLP
jgi:malonyl CoA-acyl carrier protein transacylase